MKNFKKIWLLAMLTLAIWAMLTWCGSTPDTWSNQASANYEEVALWHDGWNTVPKVTTLPAGKDYKFVITPDKNWVWCMSTVKREWTTTADAQLVIAGKPIEMIINDAQPWEYKFVCNGMWMEQGSVVIQG